MSRRAIVAGMRCVALVCLILGCGGPQAAPTGEPIGNTNAAKRPSREAFVDEVAAALTAGDANRLVTLAGTRDLFEQALACDDGGREEIAEAESAIRKRANEAAEKTKGKQITIVEVENGSETKRRRGRSSRNATLITKGGRVGSCTARTEILFHDARAKVKIDGKREVTWKLELTRFEGRWYLADIPHLSDGAGSAMAKMEEFTEMMCACREHDTACAQKVTDEMTKWSMEMARNAGDERPDDISPDDAKRMADITKKMGECAMKAMTP
jgi:hypothetical protein